jgi:hypothetical protein
VCTWHVFMPSSAPLDVGQFRRPCFDDVHCDSRSSDLSWCYLSFLRAHIRSEVSISSGGRLPECEGGG